jgi:tryptophan halogenase
VPFTRAIAHEAGWQWRIPLQHRVGNGLVYSSAHLSDDEARARLMESIEGEMLIEPRLIRFKAGRRHKAWEKNCVALGLSSGFIEPLESTSIHLIMIGVTRLMQLFPFTGVSEALTRRYNDLADAELIGIRDFIILHYCLNERPEPFWERARTMTLPDSLAQRIALFRDGAQAYQASDELFRIDSWVQVMLGQRLEPTGYHHMGRIMGDRLGEALGDIKGNIAKAVAKLPQHQEYLDGYCAEAVAR